MYYYPLRKGDAEGEAFGSDHQDFDFQHAVRYGARVYFPRLPASLRRVTVISPGTTGEFTGVPVTDAPSPRAGELLTEDQVMQAMR
jgi:hypothetical protein